MGIQWSLKFLKFYWKIGGVSDFYSQINIELPIKSHRFLKNPEYFQTLRDSNNFPQNFQTFPQNINSSRRLLNALRAFLCLCGTMVAHVVT